MSQDHNGGGGGGPSSNSNTKELYALLHISPEASDEEIRKAYRQWAQIYHPDKYQAPQVCNFNLCFYLLLLFKFQSKLESHLSDFLDCNILICVDLQSAAFEFICRFLIAS